MLRALLFTVALMGMGSFAQADIYPVTPDPEMTPGKLCSIKNIDFKEYRYDERIPYCERNVTRERKTDIYLDYGVDLKKRGQYTIDHFIPLSLGGDNSDSNLWPEHKKIKELRYHLERELYEDLRDGRITQHEAIEIIVEAKNNPPIQISAFQGVLY